MKRIKHICEAGIVVLAMTLSVPVYADRSGKTELPQNSTDYYMTVDSGGIGVDIYPETSDKSEKLNDKTIEDGTVLHIEGETEKNGENWGYTEYNGTHGYVPLDELRPSKEGEVAAEKDSTDAEKDSVGAKKDSTATGKDNTTDTAAGEKSSTESENSAGLSETTEQSVVKISPVPTETAESAKSKPVNGTAATSFKDKSPWYKNTFLWIGCATILAVIGILVYHFKKRG